MYNKCETCLYKKHIIKVLIDFNLKSIQIELSKLKESYPELADYILNSSNQSTTRLATSPASETSSTSANELVFHSADDGRTASGQRAATLPATRFIYYNNETHSFEGVSMQSTYSVLQLAKNKSVTLMTTSTTLSARSSESAKPKIVEKISKSILPLYPQFVYSIRVVALGNHTSGEQQQSADVIEMLNEHSQEASKIRCFYMSFLLMFSS